MVEETGSIKRTEVSGKQKLRDKIDGMEETKSSPNHDQIWEVVKSFECEMEGQKVGVQIGNKNGSRMAGVVE